MPDSPSKPPRRPEADRRRRTPGSGPRPRPGLSGAAELMRRPGRLVPTILGSLVAFAVAGTAVQGLSELRETRQRQRELTAAVETLRAETDGLEATIARLREDPEALRLHAKSTLDLVEPGEAVVLLRFPERFGPPRELPPPAPPVPPHRPSTGPPAGQR